MIRYFALLLVFCLLSEQQLYAQSGSKTIAIQTNNTELLLTIGGNNKVYQSYLGQKLSHPSDRDLLKATRKEAYIAAGMEDLFEPAIRMVHADGNPSLQLLYTKHSSTKQGDNITLTSIYLKDPQYPVEVTLHYAAHFNEDIIRTWTEIKHQEKKAVTLTNYASSMLHFDASKYWLTQFDGDYMTEMRKLGRGTI